MTDQPNRFTVEEVSAASPPPKARVSDADAPAETPADKLGRKRDYLEGFLAKKSTGIAPNKPGGELYEEVVTALREIYDPEIPVNIYDLGLIYDIIISEEGGAEIDMTLTSPHCPVAESMPGEVELRICAVPGIRDVEVNLVWDPPWDMSKMSDEAKLELGML